MSNVLTNIVIDGARRYGAREAVYERTGEGVWTPTSWTDFSDKVEFTARALEILDIKEKDVITIFSANRAGNLIFDFAAYYNRAIPVSVYATSSPEQVEYIVNDCAGRILVVGNQKQYEIGREILRRCKSLDRLVVLGDVELDADDRETLTLDQVLDLGSKAKPSTVAEVGRRREASTPDDIATLIYTSGTTGEPKGAILPHSCFNACMEIHRERLTTLSDADTSVSFLPVSHIFEKAWCYLCLYLGMRIYINRDPKKIQDTMKEVRPTCMCSVPRFWEKVYTAVLEKLGTMTGLQKKIVDRALKVGRRRNLDYVRRGKKAPWWLETQYKFFEKKVFSLLKKAAGIENGNMFPTAGAPLSPTIVEFMQSCGINVLIGYGLSETTATVTCFPYVDYEIGTVGTTMPRVEVKIGEDDEILVKGPTVMSGYYNKPKETEAAFTADGWFRTGDAGRIDASGALVLTERLKDLFKTSNGKYIAPQAIESRLGEDKYIEQVAVIGDQRKYVTAIIVPAFEALKEYARKMRIQYQSLEDLVKNADVRQMIEERIDKLQEGLAGFEKIKKFTLLPREFTMENGELTNTLKIRRPVINRRYAAEIAAMYA